MNRGLKSMVTSGSWTLRISGKRHSTKEHNVHLGKQRKMVCFGRTVQLIYLTQEEILVQGKWKATALVKWR
jgi:hypothetical protein